MMFTTVWSSCFGDHDLILAGARRLPPKLLPIRAGASRTRLGWITGELLLAEYTLHDNFGGPMESTLPDAWFYSGAALAVGVMGGSLVSLTPGAATSGPWSMDYEAGC